MITVILNYNAKYTISIGAGSNAGAIIGGVVTTSLLILIVVAVIVVIVIMVATSHLRKVVGNSLPNL